MSRIPLMPKATAVWLVENTGLSFRQIADFCHLHELEVKGIADGDVATGINKGIGRAGVIDEIVRPARQRIELVLAYLQEAIAVAGRCRALDHAPPNPRSDKLQNTCASDHRLQHEYTVTAMGGPHFDLRIASHLYLSSIIHKPAPRRHATPPARML